MPKLSELDFTDLYVRIDARDISRYAPVPRRGSTLPRNLPVPEDYEPEIDLLRSTLERQEHDDFALDLEDMRMRGSRCDVFGEQKWVAMRRLPLDPPKLDDLGFRPEVVQQFRSWGQRSGLIVIGGATRAGKTTTAVAILTDFLRTHGGVAISVEDPVEYYLQGAHGIGGYCFQREVHTDSGWGEAVKKALRWAPTYIFLGELRTPAAAKGLLRAATSGHLAICTVHGGSIEETLSAILQIAQTELGETAAAILADGLCGVVHQSIVQGKPNVHLLATEPVQSDPVKGAIRAGKLQILGTQIEQQSVLRKQGGNEEATAARTANTSPARISPSPAPRTAISRNPASTAAVSRTMPQTKIILPVPRKKFLGIF